MTTAVWGGNYSVQRNHIWNSHLIIISELHHTEWQGLSMGHRVNVVSIGEEESNHVR